MNAIEPTATSAPFRAAELRFLGLPTWIKADRQLTGGQFSLIEQVIPAGFESPWHMHHSEDESFYMSEGEVSVIVDGGRQATSPLVRAAFRTDFESKATCPPESC